MCVCMTSPNPTVVTTYSIILVVYLSAWKKSLAGGLRLEFARIDSAISIRILFFKLIIDNL